jgi:hypothetical protein
MDVHRDGINVVVVMDHNEVRDTLAGGALLSTAVPELAPLIGPLAGIMETMDAVGGNNGVEISGAIGSSNWIILPRANGIWGNLIHTVQEITSFIATYTTPLGLLTKFGIPFLGHLFGSARGEVHCDENNVGQEEPLVIVATPKGQVGLLSWNGYYSADANDRLVYANRGALLLYETFNLRHNGDGTVSFQSAGLGTWMCSDRNRKKRMTADRGVPSTWESFTIVPLGGGRVALKDSENQYASVAP